MDQIDRLDPDTREWLRAWAEESDHGRAWASAIAAEMIGYDVGPDELPPAYFEDLDRRRWLDPLVRFDEAQEARALRCSQRRVDEADAHRRRSLDGILGGRPELNVPGAGAELAFSIFSGLPWKAEFNQGPDKGADVGEIWQVRQTAYSTGGLIVREGDPISDAYVLVIGNVPEFRVVGWAWGEEVADLGVYLPAARGYSVGAVKVLQHKLRTFEGFTPKDFEDPYPPPSSRPAPNPQQLIF